MKTEGENPMPARPLYELAAGYNNLFELVLDGTVDLAQTNNRDSPSGLLLVQIKNKGYR